jgi:transposase
MQDVFIGIDVSKDKIDVAFLEKDKFTMKEYPNEEKGYAAILRRLNGRDIATVHICMEATGRYSEKVASYFYEAGFATSVVNPLQIKRYGQSRLLRNKTDRADARVIAQFCEAMKPTLWQPPKPALKTLRNNVRQLDRLKNLLLQENNRLLEETDREIQKSIKRIMRSLEREIERFQEKLRNDIGQDQELSGQQKLLESIPGVGVETATHFIAAIDVERFENAKQVSAFVGLNPRQHQSGSSVRGKTRVSKMGDRQLRKMFYMPALVAIRFNPVIKEFYERLISRGKSKMVAVCAAMRKLLHIAYGVLKSKRAFSVELASKRMLPPNLA